MSRSQDHFTHKTRLPNFKDYKKKKGELIPFIKSTQTRVSELDLNQTFNLVYIIEAIRQQYGLIPSIKLKTHIDRKLWCYDHGFYGRAVCSKCDKKLNFKLSCASFFCPTCLDELNKRIRVNLQTLKFPHRQLTITPPPKLLEKLNSYQDVATFMSCITKTTNKLYTSFGQKIIVGSIQGLHTYSSRDPLRWFPHVMVYISSVGFVKCSKAFHRWKLKQPNINNKYLFNGWDQNKLYHKYCKSKYHMVNSSYIDYKKFNELLVLEINKRFKISLDHTKYKLAHFDYSKPITLKKTIDQIASYVKKIPFASKDIIGISHNTISYSSYKRDFKKLPPIAMNGLDFYIALERQIPPLNFRKIRFMGGYSPHHKLRGLFLKKIPEDDQFEFLKCPCCNSYMITELLVIGGVNILDYNNPNRGGKSDEVSYNREKPPPNLKFFSGLLLHGKKEALNPKISYADVIQKSFTNIQEFGKRQ